MDIQPRLGSASWEEEALVVEAEEVRPAVGFEGLVKGTHCQHPHPEEDSFYSSLAGEQLEYPAGRRGG